MAFAENEYILNRHTGRIARILCQEDMLNYRLSDGELWGIAELVRFWQPAKKLRFAGNLVPPILAGTKSTTWRLFDDKDLAAGDFLELFNSDDDTLFALGQVSGVSEKTFGTLEPADWDGHERYASHRDLLELYSFYYGTPVTDATPLKVVRFQLLTSRL